MAERASVHFQRELLQRIEYFRKEYSLTYEAAIGVLDIIKYRLLEEANQNPISEVIREDEEECDE